MIITGYALITQNAKSELQRPWEIEKFQGKICPILFDTPAAIQVDSPDGSVSAVFHQRFIVARFKCQICCQFIMPTGLSEFEKTEMVHKLTQVNASDPHIKQQIIRESLKRGKYYDAFLFPENN